FVWSPLTLVLPLLVGAALLPLAQAGLSAAHASFPDSPPKRAALLKRRLLTAALHLVQPLARLRGRLKEGLTPWRCRGASQPAPLWPVTTSTWRSSRARAVLVVKRSEEHTSELQSLRQFVCRLLLEKKK